MLGRQGFFGDWCLGFHGHFGAFTLDQGRKRQTDNGTKYLWGTSLVRDRMYNNMLTTTGNLAGENLLLFTLQNHKTSRNVQIHIYDQKKFLICGNNMCSHKADIIRANASDDCD